MRAKGTLCNKNIVIKLNISHEPLNPTVILFFALFRPTPKSFSPRFRVHTLILLPETITGSLNGHSELSLVTSSSPSL